MERYITYDNLRYFTYSNDKLCASVNGIVIRFMGLGAQDMWEADDELCRDFAEQGIIFLYPYNNPWNWMNRQAIGFTDEIIDVLFERYRLDENTPVVATGGSMGGQSALIYTRYAKRTPVACITSCPVCDMTYHLTERYDLPRTLYSACANEEGPLTEALKRYSPLHQAEDMPDIEYYNFHTGADEAVNKGKHSDLFVHKMKELEKNIVYHEIPDRGHCDLPDEYEKMYWQYAADAVRKHSVKR